jgi:dUTP pyrophosphatase
LFVKLNENAIIPVMCTSEAAGFDLCAMTDLYIHQGGPMKIMLGLQFNIPKGYWGEIKNKSSIKMKGFLIPSSVLDSDYTGEMSIIGYNFSGDIIKFEKHQKIAQVVFYKTETFGYSCNKMRKEGDEGGFGSTGTMLDYTDKHFNQFL